MNSNVKTIIFWAVLICVAVLLWAVVKNGHSKPDRALNFSEFLNEVEAGNIKSVSINGSTVKGDFVNGDDSFHTEVPSNYPEALRHAERQESSDDLRIEQLRTAGFRFW